MGKNKTIFVNAARLTVFCLAVVLIAALTIHFYASRLIGQEYTQRSLTAAKELMDRTEEILKQTRGMAAYLATEPLVQSFFATSSPGAIYDDYYARLHQMLRAYSKGIDYIDSVYLYSRVSDRILASSNPNDAPVARAAFADSGWLSMLSEEEEGFSYVARSVVQNAGPEYPFVLTVMLYRELSGIECVVAININLQSLYSAVFSASNEKQAGYLVSADGQIIMRRVKSALFEPISTAFGLEHFDPSRGQFVLLTAQQGIAYTYAQVPSEEGFFFSVSIYDSADCVRQLSITRWLIVVASLAIAIIGFCIFVLFSFRAYKPVRKIIALLDAPETFSRAGEREDTDVRYIGEKIISFLHTNEKLRTQLEKQLNLMNQTQIQTLQMQLSPHFLYNTLNLIGLKVASDMGEEYPAVTMLNDLAIVLRYSLESTELVPLRVERQYTQHYLHLLSERYSNAFETLVEFPEEILDVRVPRLLLQPLIENSVFHGMSGMRGPARGRIMISGRKVGGEAGEPAFIQLSIEDNGKGMPPEVLAQLRQSVAQSDCGNASHIGVRNVANRLRLLYAQSFSLEIHSQPNQGTRITLTFPAVETPRSGEEKDANSLTNV